MLAAVEDGSMAHTKGCTLGSILVSSARNSRGDLRIFTLPFKSAKTIVLLIIVPRSSAFSRRAIPWHNYYQLTIIATDDGRPSTHLPYNGRQPRLINVCVRLVTQVIITTSMNSKVTEALSKTFIS